MDNKAVVPEHYIVFAREIKPLIREIQGAFINRPVPSGFARPSLYSFLPLMMDRASKAIRELTQALNSIPGCSGAGEESVPESKMIASVTEIKAPVTEIISIFNDIWRQPFPRGFEDGQPLASAIFERILREVLAAFEKFVEIVENTEGALIKYKDKLKLDINLGNEEALRFSSWCESRRPVVYAPPERSQENVGLIGILAAFMLGYWLGED